MVDGENMRMIWQMKRALYMIQVADKSPSTEEGSLPEDLQASL